MTRQQISDGIKKIAWSYVFIYFHINLATVDILPDWWGYMLILKGTDLLKDAEPSINLRRPLCKGFVAYSAVKWVLNIFGLSPDIYILNIIITVLMLYFNFQLLTNIADIAKKYGCSEEKKIRKLIIVRTVITAAISAPLDWAEYRMVIVISAVVTLVIALYTGILLFCLKESILEGDSSSDIV